MRFSCGGRGIIATVELLALMLFSLFKNQDIPFLILPREKTVEFSKKNNFENKKKSSDSFTDDSFSKKFLQNKKLDEENIYHLRTVLRKTGEQEILLGDGNGTIALVKTDKQNQITEVLETEKIPPSNMQIHLLQAMPKKKSLDTILQKTTELGVRSLTFFLSDHAKSNISKQEQKIFKEQITENSINNTKEESHQNRPSCIDDRINNRIENRIEKIVRSACMQSRNPFVPQVIFNTNSLQKNIAEKEMFCENFFETSSLKVAEEIQARQEKSACMFLWGDWLKENDDESIIPQRQHKEQEHKEQEHKEKINFSTPNIYFINGPEGGWSKQEYNYLKSRFRSVVLSDNVLRAETAAVSALSALYFMKKNFSL